ncbi:MFS transporter [Clostridium sp. 'deep sea']|uniref:MFS transporter n=1 Tax=Clostridium sp. 'deep sea' TaxID=2779445 RepID=UPI0018964AA5|nr:MFS transporter [Clostridium sp. 'deep sea']QOR34820.1 MFS transporter [Clostridium sp. 'deep sea']
MKLLGDFKAVMKNKVFMRMWLAQAISNFGDAIVKIALIILITNKTKSVTAVSTIMAIQIIPIIFVGPFAGVIIDRASRKLILIASDIARAMLIMGIVYAPNLAIIYLCSFFIGLAGCFYTPARMSLTPDIVGKEQFMSAQSLTTSTYHALALAGPALGGIIVACLGVELAFIIDSLTFVISAFILLLTTIPQRVKSSVKESYLSGFKSGLQYIKGSKQLLFLLSFSGLILLIAGGYSVLFIDYINNVLKASPTHFGFIQSMLATGLLLASLLVGYFSKKIKRGSVIVNSMLLSGMVSCFMFTKPGVAVMYIWAFVIGSSDGLMDIPLSSLLIDNTNANVRGRVMSVYSSLIKVCSLLGLSLCGIIAKKLGTANTMGLMGLLMMSIAFFARFIPSFKLLNEPQAKTENKIVANVD